MNNRRIFALLGMTIGALAAANGVQAADCPGHPNALGTSRVMTIDPQEYPRIGSIQYAQSLPLQDKEVVLTFDDGPLPPYSNRILEILAEHCIRANYFIIGKMARGYPGILRQIHAAGHTVGTHTQNHPLNMNHMPLDAVKREIEQGIASVITVLGKPNAVAPFFRIPGLSRARQIEGYLQSRGLTAWSADLAGDDWKHISASEVVRRVMARLAEKGKGIVLLHDIQPATALALPVLLRQMKAQGYRVVQVVPGKPGTPVAVASAVQAQAATKPAAQDTDAQAQAEPSQAEPAKSEPAQAEPTQAEPTQAEPAQGALAAERTASQAEASARIERADTAIAAAVTTVEASAPAQSPAVSSSRENEASEPNPEPAQAAAADRTTPAPAAVTSNTIVKPPAQPQAAVSVPAKIEPAPHDDAAAANAAANTPAVSVPAVAAKPSITRATARPFMPRLKPQRGTATPSKLSALQPGNGINAVIVPVPGAGGAGVSGLARTGQGQQDRFQPSR